MKWTWIFKLNKKDLIAKDISINYKIYDNSENDPRLKGRSFIRDENNIIINKGSFTLVKKEINVRHGN